MQTLQRTNLIVTSLLLLIAVSCQVKDINTIDNLNVNKASVNNWAYDMMNDGYFWYKDMPARNATDTSDSPDAYFEKLIYKRQTHDRFSMITRWLSLMRAKSTLQRS